MVCVKKWKRMIIGGFRRVGKKKCSQDAMEYLWDIWDASKHASKLSL